MMSMGVKHHTQKCQEPVTPISFIWCQTDGAEMPWTNRTIGGEPILAHRNVTSRTLSPTNHRGPSAACRNATLPTPPPVYRVPQSLRRNATQGARPREGSSRYRRNANLATPFPINHRGPWNIRRNAANPSPPPNLGHTSSAAMSG